MALTLVVGNPLLEAVPSTLPTGHVGSAYSGAFGATGGIAPYQWKLVGGQLPDGLTLNGASGVISGDPTTPATLSQFTVQLSDTSLTDPQVVDVQESITVSTGPLAFGTPALPDATVGAPYQAALSVTGGVAPYAWSVTSGSLPAGLSLDSSGDVVGTASTAGTSAVTVTASDGSLPTPETASESVSITVDPVSALAVTAVIPPEGAAGQLFYQQLGATGGVAPYSWSVLSGSLPPGLSLDAYGAITGVASAAGTFQLSVGVTDSATVPSTATESLVIRVTPPAPLSILVPPLSGATVGVPYPTTTMTSSGGIAPVVWSVTAGALPPGLSLDSSSGVLSGTPTAGGTYPFTLGVSDSENPPSASTEATSISVAPAPTSTAVAATLQTAIGGQSDVLTATVTSPVPLRGTVEFTDNGSPVPGCQAMPFSYYQSSDTVTCTVAYKVSGLHTIGAVYSGDSSTEASTAPTILISSVINPLVINSSSLAGGTDGSAYPDTYLSATGGISPYTWSVTSGTLPPGMTLDANSGDLAGTPTTAGTFPFTVGVTDSEPVPVTVTQDLSVTVGQAPTTTDLVVSAGTVVAGQSATFTATVDSAVTPGGSVDFSDNTVPVASCQNVALTGSAPFTATCTVAYPTPGVHSVQATYSGDASTTSSTSTISTVTVTPGLAVATTSVPAATAGTAYPDTYLSATGGISPYTWSVTSGTLPPGMTLDANSGDLAGTPTTAGTFPFTVGVTDSEPVPVTVTQDLSVTVGQAPTTTDLAVSAGTVVAGQSATFTATVDSAVTPGGSVDFSDNSVPVASCQNVALTGSAPFTATCTVAYPTPDAHSIQATYSGDSSTTSSTSTISTVTVTPGLAVATTSVPAATAGTAYPDT